MAGLVWFWPKVTAIFTDIANFFSDLFQWGREVWLNIVGSILFLFLGIGFVKVRDFRKKRRTGLSYFLPFRFRDSKKPIYVCYGLLDPIEGSFFRSVEEGDLAAIHSVVSLLTRVYGHQRIVALNDRAADATAEQIENMVCVSGPQWNRNTELYLGMLGSPITPSRTIGKMVLMDGGQPVGQYGPEYIQPGRAKVCYGMVLVGKVQGSDGRKQNIVICSGASSLSTYGSIVMLSQLSSRKEMKRLLKKKGLRSRHKKYGIIFKVEDHSASNSEGYQFAPLNTRYLDVKIEKVIPESMFVDPFAYHFRA